MPTSTTKLALSKPSGNETNSRANFNALIEQIDAAAMKDSFFCKSAIFNNGTNNIDVTIGPGVAMFLQMIVNKPADSVYSINAPVINTIYYIYLNSAGAFSHNTTGVEVDGAIMLWKISTGGVLTTISTLDLRGIVNGSAQMVKDLLDAHQASADPHTQYALDTDLTTHKNAVTLDHPNGSVTDPKFGNRTIDDTIAAAAGADTPTRLWSKLANMIKGITGKANWYTGPITTLEALNTKIMGVINPWGDNTVAQRSSSFAYQNVAQTIVTNTNTKLIFDTEQYDMLQEFDPTIGRFTAKSSGIYSISSFIIMSINIGVEVLLRISVNGGLDRTVANQKAAAAGSIVVGGTASIKVAAGDYIEIYALHTQGSNVSTTPSPYFSNLAITRIA